MSIVQELENSIDIVELVSKYIRIKKAGTNYKAVCPFPGHSEKTASFVVSPSKQLAYCFGCHKGGGPLKFLMDLENIDFREALEELSQITGKKIDLGEKRSPSIEKNIYQTFKDISSFYQKSLHNAPEILQYLEKRGILKEDIHTFSLGFAPSGRDLYKTLKEKGYPDEIIDETKVFLSIAEQKDKFLGRIIFPLQNIRGDVIAFAGRILGSGEPKYLNSPASKYYDKSSILYGLFQGKKEISTKDFVIICEGYMDTIALHRVGYKNCVCVSGTALTEKHVQMLKRLTSTFYICFDNDKAGLNATKLSLETLRNKGIEVKIVRIEGGKDPDEYIKNGGNFEKILEKSMSAIGFYIELLEKDAGEGMDKKRKNLKELLEIVKSYSDSIEREIYLKEISKKLDIGLQIIYDEFNKIRIGKNTQGEANTLAPSPYTNEDYLMSFALTSEEFRKIILDNLQFINFCSTDFQMFVKGEKNIDDFPLEKKELLKGLSLQIEEQNKQYTSEKTQNEVIGLCQKVNFDVGNKELKKYQRLVEEHPENVDYQMKKIELARKIKNSGKNS